MKSQLVILAAAAALLLSSVAQAQTLSAGLKNDRTALMALYNAITSTKPKTMQNSWGAAKNPCAPVWKYITCDEDNRVSAISLPNLRLSGTLPESLGTMSALTKINLSGNKFTGTLPAAWASRRTFQELVSLNLNNNLLSGGFPPEWITTAGAFPELSSLDISYNDFTGTIPNSWNARALNSLQKLIIAGNDFTGDLPSTFGNLNVLPQLMNLDMSDNDFSGGLPSGWGSSGAFQYAVYVDLSNNNITGTLPTTWAAARSFPRLKDLILSQNDLGNATSPGALPSQWLASTAFPDLDSLVMFPGNQYVCGTNTVAAGYDLTDEDGSAFNGDAIPCPTASGRKLRKLLRSA